MTNRQKIAFLLLVKIISLITNYLIAYSEFSKVSLLVDVKKTQDELLEAVANMD